MSLVPVSPRLGYSLKKSACNTVGECEKYIELLAACTEVSNTQVVEREGRPIYIDSISSEQTILVLYADSQASVVSGSDGVFERYRFFQAEDALLWLVGRDPLERQVIDASQGIYPSRFSGGLINLLDSFGLSAVTSAEPTSNIKTSSTENGQIIVEKYRDSNSEVKYRITQVLGSLGGQSANAGRFYNWLGLRAPLSVQISLDSELKPTSVSISGYGRENWTDRELSRRSIVQDNLGVIESGLSGSFVLRSYALNLSASRNQAAFDAVTMNSFESDHKSFPVIFPPFENGQTAKAADYGPLAERILHNGTYTESYYRVAHPVTEPSALLSSIDLQLPTADLSEPELENAFVRDFSRPETRQMPLVNCEAAGDTR